MTLRDVIWILGQFSDAPIIWKSVIETLSFWVSRIWITNVLLFAYQASVMVMSWVMANILGILGIWILETYVQYSSHDLEN